MDGERKRNMGQCQGQGQEPVIQKKKKNWWPGKYDDMELDLDERDVK